MARTCTACGVSLAFQAMSMRTVYLDHNATTPVSDAVMASMHPFFRESFGNPSSLHLPGRESRKAVETARGQVAGLLNASPAEIIFTGCGSESNNLALTGTLSANPDITRIITCAVEHSSILKTCSRLTQQGYDVKILGVDKAGQIDLDQLSAFILPGKTLISLMWANNETGVIFPVSRIAECAKEHSALIHVDAIQAVGKLAVNVQDIPVDYLSISGHKLHAPKGVAALYCRTYARLKPIIHGGDQERGLRAGTLNVAGIVGLGEACREAADMPAFFEKTVAPLRDRLENAIITAAKGATVNGGGTPRLANTTNITLPDIEADSFLYQMSDHGIYASAASACTSEAMTPSHVITAMGRTRDEAARAIRFSLGRKTSSDEIDFTIKVFKTLLA